MVLIRYLIGGNDSPARSSQYYSLRTFWDLTIDGSIGRGGARPKSQSTIRGPSPEKLSFSSILGPMFILVSNSLVFFWRNHAVLRSTMVHSCMSKSVQKKKKNFLPALGHTN